MDAHGGAVTFILYFFSDKPAATIALFYHIIQPTLNPQLTFPQQVGAMRNSTLTRYKNIKLNLCLIQVKYIIKKTSNQFDSFDFIIS